MDISRAKLLVFWLCSTLSTIINGEVVIPSSFMTLDPYTEAQHHYETVTPVNYKPQVLPQVSHDPPLSYNVVPGDPYDLLHQIHQQSLHQLDHHLDHLDHLDHQQHYQQTHHQPQYNKHQKPSYEHHAQTHHKPEYNLHHEPSYKPHTQSHHQSQYNKHHESSYKPQAQTYHQPQYNKHHEPSYKPHAQKLYIPHPVKLPVTPHVAHDKNFFSHNAHTQHLTYAPPKIQKLIKKTPLDFPKKGYISHKLTPSRDEYARALYFPSSGYNIDTYFHDFPAFGYFNYEPKHKLHGLNHHRRRRMLNFSDIDKSKGQNRMPRSSTTEILTSKKVQDFEDTAPILALLHRVSRTTAEFPKAPMLPSLLKPRSPNDKKNSWFNQ